MVVFNVSAQASMTVMAVASSLARGGPSNQVWPPNPGVYLNQLGKRLNHKDAQIPILEFLNPILQKLA